MRRANQPRGFAAAAAASGSTISPPSRCTPSRSLTKAAHGNLTAVWEATNRQDKELVEITQAGVRSPAYEPGPYSPHTEGLVEQFCEWYVERLAAGLRG